MIDSRDSLRRVQRLAVLAVLGLLGLGRSANAGTVTGTVKDSVSNAVLSGVLVKVNQQSGKQATTNTSGVYSIASVAAGTVTLNASKAAYITKDTGNVVVPSSGTVTVPAILLVKMGTITGKVVNVTGGAAVASATVTVTGTSTTATTNSSGSFTLYQPTGTVTLTVTKSGWVTRVTGNLSVTNNQTTAAGNVQITQNGTLSGKAVNALGAAAVSGATVLASPGGATATTSSTGAFSFSIAPGSYTLTVTKSGWISQMTSAYTVTANTTTATGNISISQSAITGTVVNSAGGAALSGATVTVTGTSNTATSGASGNFTLSLAPSTVTLTVTKTGFQTTTTGSLTTVGGQTTNAGNVQIGQASTLGGKVVNALGGAAVSGATVTASPGGSTTTTNGTGDFSLSLAAGTYTLAVAKSAWITTNTSSYSVTPGQTTATGSIAFSQSAISGTVVAAAGGAPVPGANVQVTGSSNSTTTDAAGTFRLSLAPSTVTLTVTKASWRNLVTGNTTTTGGQTSNVGSLTFVETATVNGYVKDSSSGTGISGATIVLTGDAAITTTTDGAGSFTLTNVPLGDRSLDVSASDYQSLTTSAFAVSSGSNAVPDILLGSGFGSINGIVKDASTGFPLVGALVQLTSNTGIAAETDGLGEFQLTNVPSGAQTLTVQRGWYQALESASFSVAGGSPTVAPALSISPLPSGISGHVYFVGTRDPLEGATITLARNGQSVASGADGSFAFSGLAAGYEYVLVSKSGYRQAATGEIYLDPDGTPDLEFELAEIDPSYPVGLVHGFVLDSSGNPLPGATVTAIGLASVLSAADGSYAVAAPSGSYVVRASKAGHLTQLSRLIPGPGYFRSPWQGLVSFRLPSVGATGALTVNTIEPISRVAAAGEQVLRTPSGLYIVRTPATGSRTLSSFPAGVVFSGWTVPTVIPAGGVASVSLDAWPVLPQVSPHWAAAGQVFREVSRTPIPNVSVAFSNPGASFSTTVTTDSNGRFSLAGAPLGEYSVTATGPGLPVSNPWAFTATDDSYQGTVGFFLRDPAEDGHLAVTSPLPGAIVTSNEWSVAAQASSLAPDDYVLNTWADVSGCAVGAIAPTYGTDGRSFSLSFSASCPSGPSNLVISVVTAAGLLVQTSVPVTVANPPRISGLDLGGTTVLGGFILNGSVSLVEAAPAGGAAVTLSSDGNAAEVPGVVTVEAGASTAIFQTVTKPVSAATIVHVTASNSAGSVTQALDVEPAAAPSSLAGHLTYQGTQTPIPSVVVTLARTGQSVTTDESGTFTFEGLSPGWENLVISGPALRHYVTNEIVINPGDVIQSVNLDIEAADATMPDGVLRGTVRDSSGAPLAGATVTVPGLCVIETGADGTYQIVAPAGAYVLRAEKQGYRSQLCRRHQGAGYFRTAWEIWQDFTLPLAGATGTVEVTTIEPVSRVAGRGVDWLRPLFGLYPVETPTTGTRVITEFPAGIFFDNAGFRIDLSAGGSVSLSADGAAVIPGTPPSWAAAGIVRKTASHSAVSGASILLENPSEGFSTTVTTDANGRFSLSGGPVGDYAVTGSAAGLPAFGPWSFNAANDGGLRGVAQFDVRDPVEDGTLSITAPPSGAVLASSTWTFSAEASLPIPDDYLINIWIEIPNCTVGAASPTYQPGGRAFSVSLPVSCLSGARTVTLSAVTRYDAVLTATVPITVQNPAGVQEVILGTTSILGGIPVDGSVILSESAPSGGKVLSLVSDRPDIAAVPASVLVPQGNTSATFVVTTFPVGVATQARITASVGASTASALLQVRPNTVQQLTLGSGSVSGGSNTSALVRVGEAAPAAGTIVVLASSQPAIASVPATVTVTQGQTTAGFTVTTAPVLIEASSSISATIGSSSSSQTIVVRASAPLGEISEGNAASWTAVATDAAMATLSDDSSRAAMGSSSLRLTSSSVAETGWAFPGSGSLHWDLSGRTFLSFWLYVPSNGPALATGQPVVVLTCASGSYRYEPSTALITTDAWRRYDVPVVPAESQWIRTASGTPSLTDVLKIEIRLRPQSAGLTASLDGVVFAGVLAGDLAEGNATGWGVFSSDSASASVVDSSLSVRSGAFSLQFTTASGFDSGLTFLADGLAHWNLSDVDSLSFWITPTNNNYPGFQGNQPIVVLKTPSGSYRYEPAGTLINSGVTRLYQIPLAGGGPWTRTVTGSPNLQDTNQMELHFDTWGYGYSLSIDGVTFGRALPAIYLSPRTVTAGQPSNATITLGQPAPTGGAVVSMTSSDASATVPTSVLVPEGAQSLPVSISTSYVSVDTAARISWTGNGERAEAMLMVARQPGVVTGTVVSATGGQPVPGATVVLSANGGTGLTDSAGVFRITCAAASYTVSITKDGWVAGTGGPVTVTPGQTTDMGSLPLAEYGSLTGVVVSAVGFQPVPGATVTMSGGCGTRTTDAAGAFTFSCAPGSYTATIAKPNWVSRTSGPATVVPAQATSMGTIPLTEYGSLTGVVVSAVGSQPVPGATVTMSGGCGTRTTDAAGAFTFSCAPGTYTTTIAKSNWVSAAAGPVTAVSAQATSMGTIPLTEYGSLTGVVVSAVGSQPVPGATVTMSGGCGTRTTDAAGAFSLACAPESYTVTISKSAFVTRNAGPFGLTSGATTSAGTIPLTAYGIVAGTVKKAADGSVVAGASVVAASGAGSGTSNAQGRFALTLVPGPTSLTVSKSGLSSVVTGSIAVQSEFTIELGDILLADLGTVTGLVVNATSGAPLSGATVAEVGTSATTTTDATGHFTLAGVSVPSTSLRVSAAGFATLTRTVAPVGGQTTDVGSLLLSPLGSVSGLVKGRDVALSGVRVAADGGGTVYTNTAGEYVVPASPGHTTLTFTRSGWKTEAIAVDVVSEQTTNAPVVSMRALLWEHGRAVDPAGIPVSGAIYRTLTSPVEQCVTSSAGEFSILLPEGANDMEWIKTGYRRKVALAHWVHMTVFGDGGHDAGDVRLAPGPGTDLEGTVRSQFTLDQVGGPWELSTLSVEQAASLSIEPGVTARFTSDAALTIKGRLTAIGTPESPILLAGLENWPAGSRWMADLEATNESTVLWTRFEGTRIYLKGGTPKFAHVTVTATQSWPFAFVVSDVDGPVLRSSEVPGHPTGVSCSGWSTHPVDFRLNYWGAANGPSGSGPGSGSSVDACAAFEPWLMSSPGPGHEFTSGSVKNSTFSPANGTSAHISFETSDAGAWSTSILDTAAQVVRSFTGVGSAGAVDWDGKDGGGNLLPDGQYFFEISSSYQGSEAPKLKGRLWKASGLSLEVGAITASPALFSPNGDGVIDTSTLSASMSYPDAVWTLAVKNAGDMTIRSFAGTGPVAATWDGRDTSGLYVPDGSYTLVVTATDDLATATQTAVIEVDAIAPEATVSAPMEGLISNLYRNGATNVDIVGTASDAHLASWTLDVGPGSAPTSWTLLAYGSSSVTSANLGSWAAGDLPNGQYSLRVRASDSAGNSISFLRPITIANIKVTQSAASLNVASGGSVSLSTILPMAVTETIEIHDESNAFVRNLVSGVSRSEGTFADVWDGKGAAGGRLHDGQYRWVASFTDGVHSMAIDLSAEMQSGAQLMAHPGYGEWDPFNNKPLKFTHTFDAPGRIGMVFYMSNWIVFLSCDAPLFCRWIDEVQPAGPQTIEWAGVDDKGAYRPDVRGIYVFSNRSELSKNCIIVHGGRPKVSSVKVTPAYFAPEHGPQEVSFQLASLPDETVNATISFLNQESLSTLRTLTLTGVQAGTVTASWDGLADNGMPVAPGRYTVTVRVTDSHGHAVEGQILTTIEY